MINLNRIKTNEELHEIFDPIFKKYGLKNVWLFGSYAKGKQTMYSDVDFMYEWNEEDKRDIMKLLDFSDEMFQLSDKYFFSKCDLVDYDDIKKSKNFKHVDILSTSQLFYEI